MGCCAASYTRAWVSRPKQRTIGSWRAVVMLNTVEEGGGIMEMIVLGMGAGKEDVGEERLEVEIEAAVGAEPTVEATEDAGPVNLLELRGLEIFGNFQTRAQARGATRTPLAELSPHTVAGWSR